MANTTAPLNTPVWINEEKCKACDKCVATCPAGVLAMKQDIHSTIGSVIKIIHPEACIGCGQCELVCPDFAICVASRKEYKFAKLTNEAIKRKEALIANNYQELKED